MSTTFKIGDEVEWDSSEGTIHGKIKKKLTSDTEIKGHKVKATEDEPQYLVESSKTGAEAAHKPDALRKKK